MRKCKYLNKLQVLYSCENANISTSFKYCIHAKMRISQQVVSTVFMRKCKYLNELQVFMRKCNYLNELQAFMRKCKYLNKLQVLIRKCKSTKLHLRIFYYYTGTQYTVVWQSLYDNHSAVNAR